MNPLHQMIHGTKAGTSKTSSKESPKEPSELEETQIEPETIGAQETGPSQSDLNRFFSRINAAQSDGTKEIEVDRKIIDHFNPPSPTSNFDKIGYFMYQNVKVFEFGKKGIAKEREGLSIEQMVFGRGRDI